MKLLASTEVVGRLAELLFGQGVIVILVEVCEILLRRVVEHVGLGSRIEGELLGLVVLVGVQSNQLEIVILLRSGVHTFLVDRQRIETILELTILLCL